MLLSEKQKLQGIASHTSYTGGEMQECRLNERNVIHTRYGELVPQYTIQGFRKKELKSLSFYRSGNIRSICLEDQTDVQTPLGVFPAELVTFYEDGSLDSVFPLNGQIGFGWSEAEEAALAEKYDFNFPFASFSAKIIGLRFYASGRLKSLTLWPGEKIRIKTPLGEFPARIGFKLYENGSLESFEPASPVTVETPIGPVKTFDTAALAIDASVNSVQLDRQGGIAHLVTSGDIFVLDADGTETVFSSRQKLGLMDDTVLKVPIDLFFNGDTVLIDNGARAASFAINKNRFTVRPDFDMSGLMCDGNCDGCTGCI